MIQFLSYISVIPSRLKLRQPKDHKLSRLNYGEADNADQASHCRCRLVVIVVRSIDEKRLLRVLFPSTRPLRIQL